jgi:hypothetical protein
MMKPAESRHRDDAAHRWRLDLARHWRVTPERHVRAVGVVVRQVLAKDPTQVVLAEHDHVVDDLATRSAHSSLGEPVLPRGSRRDSELSQPEILDASVERGAEDLVAVADQSCDLKVGADRLNDLLCRPFGRRAHVVAELRKLTRDPATAPERVLASHLHDERDDRRRERGPSDAP